MSKNTGENAREKLLVAGTDLFRRHGFVATSVDQICTEAGVTKGAFFHHFDTKEALAEACLAAWDERFKAMFAAAPFQSIDDPLERLLTAIDFFVAVFSNPQMHKSCLAGTTVQEVAETHPVLRDAAQACFASGEREIPVAVGRRLPRPPRAARHRVAGPVVDSHAARLALVVQGVARRVGRADQLAAYETLHRKSVYRE